MKRRDVRYQAAVVRDDHVLLPRAHGRERSSLRGEVIVVGSHGNLLALILQHWFPSVDHAFWSRLTMPDIYTLTLRDDGPPELARRWDAGDRFVPK